MGQAFGGADRRLGQGARQSRGVAVLHDDSPCAEGQGRAEDGADILGVGQLVQHDDDAFSRFGQVFQRHALQRLDLEGQALMDRAGRQHPGQGLVVDGLDPVAVGQLAVLDLGGALGRSQKTAHAAPRGIRQSRQNRVAPPQEIIRVGAAPVGRTLRARRLFAPAKALHGGLLASFSRPGSAASESLFFTAFTVVAF